MIFQDREFVRIPGSVNGLSIRSSIGHTLDELRQRGFDTAFRKETTCLYAKTHDTRIVPEEFMVRERYHFAEQTDPSSERIIYAISTLQGYNGYMVDTCFVYEDNTSPEMREKLSW